MNSFDVLAQRLPVIMQGWLWFGVAWLLVCRLRRLGPESRRLINVAMALAGTGAIGQALALVIPFSTLQLRAIDLATAGGIFGYMLAFTEQWQHGAPEITRRVPQRHAPQK